MTLTATTILNEGFGRMLNTFDYLLDTARSYADEHGIAEETILQWRVHPTMLPFRAQFLIGCDVMRRGMSRMAGIEPESVADTEASFADLKARVARTRDIVQALPEDRINADPDKEVSFPFGGGKTMTLTRQAYLLSFVQPNVYFHVSAAYLILRHIGVPLGKRDFLRLEG